MFLSALLAPFDKMSLKDLPLLGFLADVLVSLKFAHMDEPLFVVYHINRVISLNAASLRDRFKVSTKP